MAEEQQDKIIQIAARERGPGPGHYGLPSTCGYIKHDATKNVAPAYSMRTQLPNSMFRKDCSPGPAYAIDSHITNKGKDGTPVYSVLGRQKDPNTFKTPGPGTYFPEKVHPQGEKHAPNYSMGSRTRYRKRDSTPAPSSYTLPAMLGSKVVNRSSAASYSMTGRSKTGGFSEDLAKTPGPGQYKVISPATIQRKSPAYSIQPRSMMPGDATKKPGPGAHSPEKVYITKQKAPSFSMGIKHSPFTCPLIIDVQD